MKAHIGESITDEELVVLKNIKLRREPLRYTQEFVAKELGISQNAYSRIETGSASLKVHQLVIIAKALDCHVMLFLLKN